jgi:hypothetical protein
MHVQTFISKSHLSYCYSAPATVSWHLSRCLWLHCCLNLRSCFWSLVDCLIGSWLCARSLTPCRDLRTPLSSLLLLFSLSLLQILHLQHRRRRFLALLGCLMAYWLLTWLLSWLLACSFAPCPYVRTLLNHLLLLHSLDLLQILYLRPQRRLSLTWPTLWFTGGCMMNWRTCCFSSYFHCYYATVLISQSILPPFHE